MAIPTRKEWRKIRDDAGGKEGESKKVSVGKALDTFHKVAEKSAGDDVLKALQALEKSLNTYYSEIKSSNPKLAKAVTDKLITEIGKEKKKSGSVAQFVDGIEDTVDKIWKHMKKDPWEKERDKVHGGFRLIRDAANKVSGLDPDNCWAQIHRVSVLALGDLDKLDSAIGKNDKVDQANKQAKGTVEDALTAIEKHLK